MPVSVCCVNLSREPNVAYVVRAASCFGAFEVCVIGSIPPRRLINDLSGSTYDYIQVRQFSTPESFIEYCRERDIRMVSLELSSENFPAIPIKDFRFDFSRKTCLIVGNESIGVPVALLATSERVFIPMMSFGRCLNTSQTANVALYEASARFWGQTYV